MAEIDEQLYKELIDKIKTYHPSDDFPWWKRHISWRWKRIRNKRENQANHISSILEGGIYSGGAGAGYGDHHGRDSARYY